MELTNTCNNNSLNQMQKLKSSPVPIQFISFNKHDEKCNYCENIYSETLLFSQKYCKNCVLKYFKDNNTVEYLDVHILKLKRSNVVISHFKQIISYMFAKHGNIKKCEKDCKLCGKLIYQKCFRKNIDFRLCSDCYKISTGWIASTLTKKTIPILYLPWWDARDRCTVCNQILKFNSDHQKWCSNCIMIYIGCRYCLTTNIIFGITDQSQCKKCERMLLITIEIKSIEKKIIFSTKINSDNHYQIVNYIDNRVETSPLEVYSFIKNLNYHTLGPLIDWCSISQITNVKNLIVPIMFIPFNNNEDKCHYCNEPYFKTLLFQQKYCKYCLFLYIKYTANNTLDVCINTKQQRDSNYDSTWCDGHKSRNLDFYTKNIREWCNSCSEVSYFKQIVTNYRFDTFNEMYFHGKQKLIESGKHCKLCEKLIHQISSNNIEFKLCPNCYQIFFEWIESTLTEKEIPILYLPWWDANNQCISCDQILEFNSSNCQKWCSNCIIIYIGCRYCLTTNIIFGITNQSKCKKCDRILNVDSNKVIEEVPDNKQYATLNNNAYNQIAHFMNNINENSNQLEIYNFIIRLYLPSKSLMDRISYLQIMNLENNENNESVIVPIIFIPFDNNKDKCHYCKESYSVTPLFQQKYCRYCLFLYFKYSTNNNLDIYISTKDTQCNRHRPRSLDFCTQNIQEWCNSCSEVLYFKQVVTNCRFDGFNDIHRGQKFIESGKYCKLCGKLIYDQISLDIIEFKLCKNCYQISSGLIESTMTEKTIPIIYLPWWDANNQCISCDQTLKFNSDHQKWCSNCIIIYIGCRYCLTTNIIFGITNQPKCKKCDRLLNVDDEVIEEVPDDKQYAALNNNAYNQIAHFMNNINENSNQLDIYNFIARLYLPSKSLINWISYSQTSNLENNESVIVPIVFIPFDNNKDKCYYCKEPYSVTPLFQQKYCRYCLFLYFKYTTNNNLDVYISTKDIQCNRHKPRSLDFCTQNIQEWCNSCSEVLYFKQVVTNCRFDGFNDIHGGQNFIDSGKYCKLCGKLIYDQISLDNIEFKLCKNCYQISSGFIESTMTEKTIPIIYLPWWDANNQCIFCDQTLEFNSSNCQKWCSNCIIIYIGCRYCLTTNIIFGITNQSQCKKCQEVTLITIDIKSIEREIFVSMRINFVNHFQIVNYIDDNNDPLKVYDFIRNLDYISLKSLKPLMDWISYAQITDLENLIVPIMFIPFNNNVDECHYCKEPYSVTPLFQQKYCRYCLFLYFKYTTNNNLDIYISTKDTQCNRHRPRSLDFCTQNIQEWCNSCSEVLYFKQVVTNCRFDGFNDIHGGQNFIESGKYCKLCGKLIYDQISLDNIEFKLCKNCYQISSGFIESTMTEKTIPIIYLPWWDANNQCVFCDQTLEFNSDHQKWCSNCIIIYIGCRYCLTTNIIFGITNQSQCKKCDRILNVVHKAIKEVFDNKQYATFKVNAYNQISHFMNIINENSNQLEIYNFIIRLNFPLKSLINWISYSQTSNLENNENIIVPIMFIPFNNNEDKCHCCKEPYSVTLLFKQKYCRYCLFLYFKYTANNNLDIYISTKDTQCNRHKPRSLDFCTQNSLEWCNSCSEVSYFKQVVTNFRNDRFYNIHRGQKFIESGKYCKFCKKLIYDQILSNNIELRLCPICYQISFGFVESTLTEKFTPILYLPWWDGYNQCIICDQNLEFNSSDCQKWCSNCIIIYIGCRYCLTTNIIFEITNQSQCKTCKRMLFITVNVNIHSGMKGVFNNMKHAIILNEITNFIENILNENTNPLIIYDSIKRIFFDFRANQSTIKEIPFSQISNLKQIAKGGFGIVYKATWMGNNVAVKRFLNSQNISKSFLNEIISFIQCYNRAYIIKVHGITQDLQTKDFMLVMEYASGGNLHNYLQGNFVNITWNKKLRILWNISEGLNIIHGKNFMHRDFHSGNILLSTYEIWLICDLGLSQPANNSLSNNEIYGVIPYIAPEMFRGSTFSKESDIYSLGMIMWELTTGNKPFADVEHDINLIYKIIDGKRPEITNDTPECYANLMKRCWNSDPSKRPLITEVTKVLGDWYRKNECVEQHEQAERKRLELIQLKQLGPKFSKNPHHRAIYTSRPLSFMISDPSSIFSFNLRQGNITEKLNVDIDSIDKSQGYISEDINFDIDNIDTSKSLKRSNSQNGTQGHGKRSKTDSNL
ncbi:unnamed protein product [Rhizophagus irregularis]|nr:unnamed protein product [Rhizophagus irregularis]